MAGTPSGCLESPGRSGPGMDASPGSSSGGRIRNVTVEQSWAIPIAGMQEDAAARRVPPPCPAVTLSDMGGRGERSPSRRYDRRFGCQYGLPGVVQNLTICVPLRAAPTVGRRLDLHTDERVLT
jgi:hypothetical protein